MAREQTVARKPYRVKVAKRKYGGGASEWVDRWLGPVNLEAIQVIQRGWARAGRRGMEPALRKAGLDDLAKLVAQKVTEELG